MFDTKTFVTIVAAAAVVIILERFVLNPVLDKVSQSLELDR